MSETNTVAINASELFGGLRSQYQPAVDKVESSRLQFMKDLYGLIDAVDTKDRRNWRYVICAALEFGVDDDDLSVELGTSSSTVYRWINDDVAPREGTRRLMKGALLRLLETRIQDVSRQLHGAVAVEA